jgi:hypothetical protein
MRNAAVRASLFDLDQKASRPGPVDRRFTKRGSWRLRDAVKNLQDCTGSARESRRPRTIERLGE